jgi:arabinogalactan endo-1,4-beta-galactosidase
MKMSKQVKYGDFFIDPTKKRRIRKMRAEVREQRIKEYTKRAEKELPLFEGDNQ